jgi:CRP-like cAMP-binding protein
MHMEQARDLPHLPPQAATQDVQAFLVQAGQEQRLEAGEVLYRAGQEDGALYLLCSGTLRAYRFMEEDRREVLGWIRPGEILGELEFLDGGPRTIWVEAMEAARVFKVDREIFGRLADEDPGRHFSLVNTIARALSERLRMTNELCKREILRGMESSGAHVMDLQYVMRDAIQLEVALRNGERIAGRIVLMARSHGTYQITILEDGGDLVCIPYASVAGITARG